MEYKPAPVNFLDNVRGVNTLVSVHYPSHIIINQSVDTYPNKNCVKMRENIHSLLTSNKYVMISTNHTKYMQNLITEKYFPVYNVIILSSLTACTSLRDIHFLHKYKKAITLFILVSGHTLTDNIIKYIKTSDFIVIQICSRKLQKPLNSHEIEHYPNINKVEEIKHCIHDIFQNMSIYHKILLCVLYYTSKKNTTFLNIKLCNVLHYLFPTIYNPYIDVTIYLHELAQNGLIFKNLEVNYCIKQDILRFISIKQVQFPKLKCYIKDDQYGNEYVHIRVKLNNMKTYSQLKRQYQANINRRIPIPFTNDPSTAMKLLNEIPMKPINKYAIYNTLYAIKGIFHNTGKNILLKTRLIKELKLYVNQYKINHFKDYAYILNNSEIFKSIIKYGAIYIIADYCVSLQIDSTLLKNKVTIVL